jgi:hypothetical protein
MAYNVRAAVRAVKNTVYQFSEVEVKVREATNNDPWGVSTSAMTEIAHATNDYEAYPKLFAMLWKRLTDHEHVLHVQKALILVEFLLRHGSERFINDAKRRSRDIAQLMKYRHYDDNNRDDAGDCRVKAKAVHELLTNDARLTEERTKAQAMRDVKLSGMGSNGIGPMGGSSRSGGYGGSSFDESPRSGSGGGGFVASSRPANSNRSSTSRPAGSARPSSSGAAGGATRPKPKAAPKPVTTEEPDAFGSNDDDWGKENTDAPAPPSPKETKKAAPAALAPAAEGEKKKKKKKKKKTEEATSGATSGTATPAVAADPFGASNNSNDPFDSAPSGSSDFDLTRYTDVNDVPIVDLQQRHNGEIDILTGSSGAVGNLEDMFSKSDLLGNDDDDGFESEPALLDMEQPTKSSRVSFDDEVAEDLAKPKDIWDLANDISNLDDLRSNVQKKPTVNASKQTSMSAMRSSNPFASTSQSKSSTFFAPTGAAPMGQPGFGGPMGAPMGQQGFGGMTGGFGAPMGQPGFGGPMGGAPMGQPGFGGPMGQPGFGAAPQNNPFGDFGLPFAAQPGSSGQQSRKQHNGPIVFDVHAAKPTPQYQQPQQQRGPASGPRWDR